MPQRVLITGEAGFIGSHLADELLAHGHRVRALDCLSAQVHGDGARRPDYLSDDVELVVGDVRDAEVVRRALQDVDTVYHLAAAVGVGQSMYEVAHYTSVNNLGTAVLLEALAERPVGRLVVASSMSIYGEGLYRDASGEVRAAGQRPLAQLKRGDWEVRDASGAALTPVPTPESKTPSLASVYALSKYDQERLCLVLGEAYGIPTVALRFFNVYGPRQALSNPYTGVLAIFGARLLNGNAPLIFEDGEQRRDFVHVTDVARACRLALDAPDADGETINVGSGDAVTVRELAERLATVMGREYLTPGLTGKYRVGDIRHCFADISRARALLGFAPTVALDHGMTELAGWLEGQVADDRVAQASAELAARGAHGMSDTVLITGGAGFVGANLANRLLADGRRVIVLDNLSRAGVATNLRWLRDRHGDRVEAVVEDVRDRRAVAAAVARAGTVFHFAAQVAVTTSLADPREDFDVNALGTLNVLEAARAQPRPPSVIFTSTNKVYGALDDVAIVRDGRRYLPASAEVRATGVGEGRSLDFHSPYGCSKGAADQYVVDYARSFGVPAVVFRMSCIYGPRQFGTEDQGWVAHFLIRALEGEPITLYGDGMQVRDVLFVDDLVDAFLRAERDADRLAGSAFNVGGGPANTVSLLELLDLIELLHGRRPAVTFEAWRTGDQRYYVSDTRRLERETGWRPRVRVADGVERLYRWLADRRSGTAATTEARAAARPRVAVAAPTEDATLEAR